MSTFMSSLPSSSNSTILHNCPNCVCPPITVVQYLIDTAAKWTAHNKLKGKIPFDVDSSILIIEESSGALVYSTE